MRTRANEFIFQGTLGDLTKPDANGDCFSPECLARAFKNGPKPVRFTAVDLAVPGPEMVGVCEMMLQSDGKQVILNAFSITQDGAKRLGLLK